MKINRNSWHYKLIKYTHEYTDFNMDCFVSNACEYIGKLFKSISTVASALVIALGTFYVTINFFVYLGFVLFSNLDRSFITIPVLAGGMIIAAIIFIGLIVLADNVYNNIKRNRRYSTLGIISQYIENKKQKICTIVEYEE